MVKRYGCHEAVAGIDLEVRRGEIFAFLGPSGAGKTTTVEILEGFQQRAAGQVSVLGTTRPRRRRLAGPVGVVLQESQPEPGLSVRECLATTHYLDEAEYLADRITCSPLGASWLGPPTARHIPGPFPPPLPARTCRLLHRRSPRGHRRGRRRPPPPSPSPTISSTPL